MGRDPTDPLKIVVDLNFVCSDRADSERKNHRRPRQSLGSSCPTRSHSRYVPEVACKQILTRTKGLLTYGQLINPAL